MKRPTTSRYAALILFVAGALAACTAPRTTTATASQRDWSRELSQHGTDAVLWQNAGAEAYRCYQQGYELAEMKLDANLEGIAEEKDVVPAAEFDARQPAVIVDVDETVLDNSPFEVEGIAQGLTYTPARWKEWTKRASAGALPGSVDFLKYAADKGCAVYYITNRDADEKQWTIDNLVRAGFPMADAEHVMTREDSSDKTARRGRVATKHRVVLLVGDQLTDFDERLKDRTTDRGRASVDAMADTLMQYFVLLPNPMYGVWRDAISGSGKGVTDSSKVEGVNGFFKQQAR